MTVTTTKDSTMSKTTAFKPKTLILTSPRCKNAKFRAALSKLPAGTTQKAVNKSLLPSFNSQWEFQSALRTGQTTRADCSATVTKTTSIMILSWLEPHQLTGRSKTRGELHGESRGSSDWDMPTTVDFVLTSLHGPFDCLIRFDFRFFCECFVWKKIIVRIKNPSLSS